MCIKKIKAFHKRYAERCRNFYSSSIAGLFTGVIIGILFSLITDSKFNRWINLFSYELFAAVVYFAFIFLVLYILYFFGKLCIILFISKDKKNLISFKINYFAGVYAATWSASLIILHTKINIAIYISILFIILYFPIEYFTVRNKKKQK